MQNSGGKTETKRTYLRRQPYTLHSATCKGGKEVTGGRGIDGSSENPTFGKRDPPPPPPPPPLRREGGERVTYGLPFEEARMKCAGE